jgi:predicted RNase H-like HicB family nuclease/PHD/YefM family antitoxin component YafN of YafNO toxin-antitoxin module
MTSYIALLRKDADSDFGVEFPDFPGCVTAGSSLEEAARFAEEALRLHIDGMAEDGIALPAPSTLHDIRAAPDSYDAMAFMIDVTNEHIRVMRVDGPQTVTKDGRAAVGIVSAEEWERKSHRLGNLAEFFAESPLRGSDVEIGRTQNGPRETDL